MFDRVVNFDGVILHIDGRPDNALSEPFDECPGCGGAYPAGYLSPDGMCDECIEDIEGLDDGDE
jgi:hypothetical protein